MRLKFIAIFLLFLAPSLNAEDNGLAPEITDLNAKDISHSLEKDIPYLKKAYFSYSPKDKHDGIQVGVLGLDSGNKELIKNFAQEIDSGKHGLVDSLLIHHQGKLLFESYYRRGRANYPHYQMSITKSYTAFALGRAMQLGHIQLEDLQRPVLSFLKNIDQSNLTPGATEVSLHEAMHMRSGIRVDKSKIAKVLKTPKKLWGQGQIQTYFELSAPITKSSQTFKYQGSDPSITMQVLETVVPGSSKDFIKNDFLALMGIDNYAWQEDTSKLPKSAAGSSFRSRDMLKMGLLVLNDGRWQGQQILPQDFVEQAVAPHDVNPNRSYGYFWWRHEAKVHDKSYACISGRGAGGQFILIFKELDLIIVVTAHNKGMGSMLKEAPSRVIPAFQN